MMFRTNLNIVLILTVMLGVSGIHEGIYASDFCMIGVYRSNDPNRSFWAQDAAFEQVPLASRSEYGEARKAFMKARNGRSPWTALLIPGQASIVYEYTTYSEGFKAEYIAIGLAHGTDLKNARSRLSETIEKNRRQFRSEPKVIFTWAGDGGYKRVITRDYNGVEITFTIGKTALGRTTIIAQGRNTHLDKAAVVVMESRSTSGGVALEEGGSSSQQVIVGPGGGFTKQISSTGTLNVEVGFTEPEKKNVEAIDVIKDWVREQITTDEEKVEPSSGSAIGIRG